MDGLSYCIEENPPWRRTSTNGREGRQQRGNALSPPVTITSTEMLDAISERVEAFQNLPEKAKAFCAEGFYRGMAVQYVHQSNVGESVGTQTFEDTQTLLGGLLGVAKPGASAIRNVHIGKRAHLIRDERESINTCLSLKMFHKDVREEMEETGMLTVQQICSVHKVLLADLHMSNGNLRNNDVYTETGNGIHFYPKAERAEQQLYALIDHHNSRMEYYGRRRGEMTTKQRVTFLVKCAARLLFEFVDIHPFSDGNGRMCRLLANYVASHITPFPVAVYHTHNQSKGSHRDDYIRAIVKCRENPREGPRDLAAMILEGMYLGWDSLFRNLTAQNLLEPGEQLGPIVVRKSDPQSLNRALKRLESGLAHEGMTVDYVIEIVRHGITSTDVSSLKPLLEYEHIPLNVDQGRGVSIIVHLYP